MSELRDWLRQNKFEQYIELFQANDIDLDVLSELTEGDLEKLGVSLGNRRRMLKAFAARAAKAPKSPSETPVEAERRQVTVLFSDMVGSTALSSKFDPELFSSILRRYQDTVAGAIIRFGGFVAKFLGDGERPVRPHPQKHADSRNRLIRV
jgi:class 3 adenylate cyclase